MHLLHSQGISEPVNNEDGTELMSIKKQQRLATTMNCAPKNSIVDASMTEPLRQTNIEKTVQFGSFLKSSNQVNEMSASNNKLMSKCTSEMKPITNQNGKYGYINPAQVRPLMRK